MADETPPHAAWLYTRLSRDHSGAADSIEAQEKVLRERAAREGLAVERVYPEGAGRSAFGRTTERPEWERLLSEVEPGVVVMAVETSRFSRETEDGLGQIRRIRERGAHILTLDGNDSRTSGTSTLPLTIRLAVAEEESRNKAERILRRKAEQRRRGEWLNRAPYGHRRREDAYLEVDPLTGPYLRRVVNLALGGMGAAAIARTMNEEGVPSPGSGQWNQMTVSALLRSPVLCGWMPHRRDVFLGDDGKPVRCVVGETIISEGERGRLLAVVAQRSRFDSKGGRRGNGRPTTAILGSVLRCGRCGGALRPSGPQYVCDNARTGRKCPGGLSVTRSVIEPVAVDRVLRHLAALDPSDPDDLETLAAVAREWTGTAPGDDLDAMALEAAGKLAGARERLAKLEEDHYLRGTLSAERFESLRSPLAAQIESLEETAAVVSPEPDIGPLLDLVQSREAVEAAGPESLRSLLAAAVESMTLAPGASRGCRFTPERLSIDFREGTARPAAV